MTVQTPIPLTLLPGVTNATSSDLYYAVQSGVAVQQTGLQISAMVSQNLLPPLVITSGTTLTSAAFGKTIICKGSSAYTINLPAGASGAFINFIFDTTSFALVTLNPLSGTIDGQSSLTYGSNEGCGIYNDGTHWITFSQKIQPINALGSTSLSTTVAPSMDVQIQFNIANYDPYSFLNTSTYNYTPKYPGVYQAKLFARFDANPANADATILGKIHLNGSTEAVGRYPMGGKNTSTVIEDLLICDGSTDYISFFINQDDGGSLDILASENSTFFNITRISLF